MQALLLDHDDVLVVSEALVFNASASLINETIRRKGVAHKYTPRELKERFAGLGFTRIMAAFSNQYGFAISPEELQQLKEAELNCVVAVLEAEVEASVGAAEMLVQVCQWGITPAAVSSSELRRMRTCLRKTGLDKFIRRENVFSATDSLPKPDGKPSSAIYLYALKVLGLAPEQCLAVEDSVSGVLAAVRAKIEVVGFVGAERSLDIQSERSKLLIANGAVATFSDWTSFLTWFRPRLGVAPSLLK